MFYVLRDEKEISKQHSSTWCSNCAKQKFEPHGDLVDEAYSRCNANTLDNQVPFGQIEYDDTREAVYSNNQDEENKESHWNLAIPHFIPRVMTFDEVLESINSLNSMQNGVFNVFHNSVKEYGKYNGFNIKPVHTLLSGTGDTGKSHLVKSTCNTVSEILPINCKKTDKPRVLLLGPTGISAINIGETTIHCTLGIKLGVKLSGLSVIAKT